MAWIGALIAVGGAVAGDVMSSNSASTANDTNEMINQQNIQAAMDRQTQAEGFNAQQQQNAQAFSASQIAQQEQYQTEMANTSMQRRVADLKAAGLNPLLAVGQGGATAPAGGAAYGTPVSASPAGQGSGIPMQNTGAAFGGLGGQVSSAISTAQTQAQIDNLKAQTEKLNAESGQEIPAQVDYLKSMTGLSDANAKTASLNAQQIAAKLKYDTGEGGNYALDWVKNWATTGAATTNTDILRATKDALVSSAESDATAKQLGLQAMRNLNQVEQGKFGQVLTYLNAVLAPAGSAARAYGEIK